MVVSACPFCNKSVFTRALSHETGNRKRYRPRPAFVALPKSDRQNTKGSRHTGDHSPCVQSANFDADRDNTAEGAQQPLRGPEEASTPAWDVVGLGQPMVDFSASVEDDLLVRLGIVKGSRRVISAQQRAEVSAGGSLSNTLIGLSRLGQADNCLRGSGGLQVALAGAVGSDTLGSFFAAQAAKAGVAILADTQPESCTGTAIVLTTPDANRTFLSYLGEAHALQLSAAAQQAIKSSRMLVVEGYMWEVDDALETLSTAADFARSSGAMVVMTAGDAGVVQRHTADFWQLINDGVDMLFCNRSEAAALLGRPSCTAQEAALALGPHCKVVLVTDGAHGSCISAMGQLQRIPPCWTTSTPVDTCGAGDGYAAGALYGFLCGYDVANIGRAGARVASAVILRQGAATTEDEALQLVQSMPDMTDAPHPAVVEGQGLPRSQAQIRCM
ncbi:MAG: putative sugar kinase [Trebouxia sp. A1-2]|nr:MAG: putative sugar kinase [Trebouxia sp. A1-2]